MGALIGAITEAVATASPRSVVIGVGVLAAGAAYSAWSALQALRRARLIEDTPTAKVRSAPQGYVELWGVGRQMDGPPIIAPLSGLPCVWYRYRVEEQQLFERNGRMEQRWVTVEQGQSDDLFWLDDGTGRVVIDPEGAEVTPKAKDVWHSGGGARAIDEPAFIAAWFLKRPGARPCRFHEERLGDRQPLYALGLLRSATADAQPATVEQETVDLLREWKSDQATLKARFDLNHDGTIDQNEWMLVRAQARRETLRARHDAETAASEPTNILRQTRDPARPYLLSAFPPPVVASRYRQHAFLYSGLFLFLGIAALWCINLRFAH